MTIRPVLACLALIAAGTLSLPAHAGDTATLNVLGFSADGATFAFEEYGVQDGSGFPYANRFYIDTASDNFVPGSPIRIRVDDETASIEDARAQAKTRGQAIVSDTDLAANPGYLAGFNAVTELSADPFRIVVNPRPVFPPIDPPLEIRLEEIRFPATGGCAGVTDTSTGFRLVSVDAHPGGATELLHKDSSVPSSRGCPTGYRIGGVQTYMPFQGPSAYAVLIAVESFGFEGPDFRWMAVTRRSSQQQ
jgi:predicted secreted protein